MHIPMLLTIVALILFLCLIMPPALTKSLLQIRIMSFLMLLGLTGLFWFWILTTPATSLPRNEALLLMFLSPPLAAALSVLVNWARLPDYLNE